MAREEAVLTSIAYAVKLPHDQLKVKVVRQGFKWPIRGTHLDIPLIPRHNIAMRKQIISAFALAVTASLTLGGCATDIPAATVEQRYTSPASQFLQLSDGVRLHVRDEGPRDAPVIILGHGSNASLQTWEPWVASLKGKWRVVTFDFPAHGLTGPSASGVYSGANYVAVVDEMATKLGIERFVLGGNSMGGAVAWRYALAHPQRVAGLVLVNAAGYPRAVEGKPPLVFRIARAPVLGEAFSMFTNRTILENNLKQVFVDDSLVTPVMVNRYYDMLMRAGNRKATLTRLRAGPDDPDAYKSISTIKAPTLVLWGDLDPWIPVGDASRFTNDIQGATKVTYPNTGHLAHEERAAETAIEVDAFLTRVYGAR
jgi:pimeloyl-ACP methyl ester carboxylesterase